MQCEEIKRLVAQAIPGGEVEVTGDGYHFEVRVVSDVFAGKTPVQKQKIIYAPLNEFIKSGALHALSIKAYTPAEWESAKRLRVQ
ncbi:MAG: BolA family protein [Pseudomonadota bacterium]